MGTRHTSKAVRVVMAASLLCAGRLAAGPPAGAGAAPPDSSPRFTQAQLRGMGQGVVTSEVARCGVVHDATLDSTMRAILLRLENAAGHPELQPAATVADCDEINAVAGAGGFIVVYIPLVRFLSDAARLDVPGDSTRQRKRFTAYLASVLAHELAHITLGHTGALAERVRALAVGPEGPAPDDPRVYERALSLNDYAGLRDLDRLAHTRAQETDADRLGALYLVRAGWTMGDAESVMGHFDSLERHSGAFGSVGEVTYLRNHPRASERLANLLIQSGQLMRDQTRFDNAVALIDGNVELDFAIALLDTVLTDFPDLLAARHARGTAYARKWLHTVFVSDLKVRASLPTYSVNFSAQFRGLARDTVACGSVSLASARAEFARVLAKEELPLTLSNAAVLDAYCGNAAAAERQARRAVEILPDSSAVHNNLGVVLFLAGRYADARVSFERAIAGADRPDPAYLFNLGRTRRELQDPSARVMLRRYLASGDRSAWRIEAMTLLGDSDAERRASDAGGGSRPPTIAGVTLGAVNGDVVAVLGNPPEVTTGASAALWRYPTRSLAVVLSERDGVVAIFLNRRDAGAVDGVAVGDSVSVARARWGTPSSRGGAWEFARSPRWVALAWTLGDIIETVGIGVPQ